MLESQGILNLTFLKNLKSNKKTVVMCGDSTTKT